MSRPSSITQRPAHALPLQRASLAGETSSDPYRARKRLAEPSACPDCGAIFQAGRWRRQEALPGSVPHVCPACRRIREHNPGGTVDLRGPFFKDHGADVMALVRKVSERVTQTHVLQRVMSIEQTDDGALISTTSAHLARSIGRAVNSAWKGTLDLDSDAESAPRVSWHR